MGDSIMLRDGQPSEDEGRLFATFLNTAADGRFRGLLGPHYQRIIGEAYLSPGHDLSFEHVVFAETPRGIAGMLSCFSSDQRRQFSDGPIQDAAGIHIIRLAALSLLARGILRFIGTLPDGDYYVEAVAVSPEERGLGIGSQLLDHAETLALEAGCARIVLDVAQDNPDARRLYERRGMTVEATSPRVLFIPGTGVDRMVKTL